MKKIFSIIGMAVSFVIILMGIYIMTGEMGGANTYASISYKSAETSPYDSGWAKFGSDFYTYSNSVEKLAVVYSALNETEKVQELYVALVAKYPEQAENFAKFIRE